MAGPQPVGSSVNTGGILAFPRQEGADPDNAENAGKQMNFGFTFEDQSIPEPYFYVTAYPSHEEFSSLDLPERTNWQSEGFSGAVLTYRTLCDLGDPAAYLIQLWNQLLRLGSYI